MEEFFWYIMKYNFINRTEQLNPISGIYRILKLLLPVMAVSSLSFCFILPWEKYGVVRIYSDIPRSCRTTRGLKQQVVKKVTSEEEMRKHYGLTFLVHFNDNVSPPLYGVLYHQNKKKNKFCMALPNGEFAVFKDRQIDEHKRNIVHEVCYPLRECIKREPEPEIKR